jgi:hypothetical protein
MQSNYPAVFEREMGCTEAEWRGWLPVAFGEHWLPGSSSVPQALCCGLGQTDRCQRVKLLRPMDLQLAVQIGTGALRLTWVPLQPRRLGLAVLPRLWVRFEFNGLADPQRHAFMKRFDLYTQRGGG